MYLVLSAKVIIIPDIPNIFAVFLTMHYAL